MSCYRCMKYGRGGRQYCTNCRPVVQTRTPNKTVLVIRTPHTDDEKVRMDHQLSPFTRIRPVYIFSSPREKPLEVAKNLAKIFEVADVVTVDALAPMKRVNARVITSRITTEVMSALYIFVTHEPHCILALLEFSRLITDRKDAKRRRVPRGRIVHADFTNGSVYLR